MSADTGNASDQGTMSSMDMSEHVKTWEWFTWAIKWGVIINVLILAFLAIFRTNG
jgi:Bacterial aa3 type cytochrome c oxidase subunit IV